MLPIYKSILEKFNNSTKKINGKGAKNSLFVGGELNANDLAQKRNAALGFLTEYRSNRSKLEQLPDLTISVSLYRNTEWFKFFLNSLRAQHYPLNKITLYIDGRDPAFSVEKLFKSDDEFKDVALIEGVRTGDSSVHHEVLQRSKTDYIFVVNAGVRLLSDSLVHLVNYAKLDEKDVAAWEARVKPYESSKYYDPITHETLFCTLDSVLIRKEAYALLPENDNEFSVGIMSSALREKGFSIKYVPYAEVMYYPYLSFNEFQAGFFSNRAISNAFVRAKCGSRSDMLAGLKELGLKALRLKEKYLITSYIKFLFKASWLRALTRSETIAPFGSDDSRLQRDGKFHELEVLEALVEQPLVSVIVRTYGGRNPKMLKQSLASIIGQTYLNIEIIICEDGGSVHQDIINEISLELKEQCSIRYFPLPKKGRSFSGNVGLGKSTGKYCVFLDDDDLFFPDHIETLVFELIENKRLSACYALSWEVLTEYNGSPNLYDEKEHVTPKVFRKKFKYKRLKRVNFMPIQSVLFERRLYEEAGGFLEDQDYLEDWNLWVRYASIGVFQLVEKTTSLFRTPSDLKEREKRLSLLNSAYDEIFEINKKMIS